MKLTGLNIDCLERVLEYLEFGDLLNVATSNKRLNRVANFIFEREHSKIEFNFHPRSVLPDRPLLVCENRCTILDLKTTLKLMRCFGPLLSNIKYIFLNISNKFDPYALHNINKYCSNSLIRIKVAGFTMQHKNLKHLVLRPFAKVVHVELWDSCNIDDKNTLNRLFPQMTTLTCNFNGDRPTFNANHFPNLKTFNIHISKDRYSRLVFDNFITSIFRLNTQLKEFSFRTTNPEEFVGSVQLQNALKMMKNLVKLSFIGLIPYNFKPVAGLIRLPNVNEFKISIDGKVMDQNPFLFDRLNKLDISYSRELSDGFFKFIDNHPGIKDLTLNTRELSSFHLLRIASSLPLLVKIKLGWCKMLIYDVIRFINKFKNLKIFGFRLNDDDDYDILQIELVGTNKWEFQKLNDQVTMKRIGFANQKS